MTMGSRDEMFNPENYGMVFCPNCNGSGKSLEEAKGVDICMVCGGFGLIKKGEENNRERKI
jgi:DnaJ-class molecular chaperone